MRANVKARRYHITFEPLFDRISDIDFTSVEWIVIGSKKAHRKGQIMRVRDGANTLPHKFTHKAFRFS